MYNIHTLDNFSFSFLLKPSTYKTAELHSCINHISGSLGYKVVIKINMFLRKKENRNFDIKQ